MLCVACVECSAVMSEFSDFLFAIARQSQSQAAQLLHTSTDAIVLMCGEGMLALWAALKSTVAPGDTVLALG